MQTPADKKRGRRRFFPNRCDNFLSIVFLLLSCSVLEDRSGCPCRLLIHISRPENAAVPEDSLSLLLSALSWQECRSLALPPADLLEVTVPKQKEKMSLLAAVSRGVPGNLSASGFEIPLGTDCPTGLLLGACSVDTDREEASCRLDLHKQVCRLSIHLKSGEDHFPFYVRVFSDVSGYTPSGALLKGDFSFDLPPFDEDGYAVVGLPRQAPDGGALRMEILFSDEILRTFALGAIMARGGYDWTAPDLADADMELDYARTLLTLRTGTWSETVEIEKVL